MPKEQLEFTKQEPVFLRKLREQYGGPRNNAQAPRPQKSRLRTGDDDEDDPVIVDEEGTDVAKAEWEGMLKREKEGEGGDSAVGDGVADEKEIEVVKDDAAKEGQCGAEIGATKKRKVGKVVGEDEAGRDEGSKTDVKPSTSSTKDSASAATNNGTAPAKTKKKAKKIKLSFDDPD